MEMPDCLRHMTRSLGSVSRSWRENGTRERTDDDGTWWRSGVDMNERLSLEDSIEGELGDGFAKSRPESASTEI